MSHLVILERSGSKYFDDKKSSIQKGLVKFSNFSAEKPKKAKKPKVFTLSSKIGIATRALLLHQIHHEKVILKNNIAG